MKNKFETEMRENNTLCSQMLFINISIHDIFIYSLFTFEKLRSSVEGSTVSIASCHIHTQRILIHTYGYKTQSIIHTIMNECVCVCACVSVFSWLASLRCDVLCDMCQCDHKVEKQTKRGCAMG